MTTPAEFEALASQLKADGYNANVVVRKLISQHGMDEASAVALVSRLFGRMANPRAGDTTSGLVAGALMVAASLVALAVMWGIGVIHVGLVLLLLALAGAGAATIIKSLVNWGAKTDL